MAKTWVSNKVDVYFEDLENEKTVRKGYSNVIENPTDEQISAFSGAVGSLYDFEKTHTILTQSHKVD